jgi:protein phosphatase
MIVPVVGKTPGRRYGHSLVFFKPYLLVFGGNTGTEPVNDTWCLNVDKAPFSWSKLETESVSPCVRVYHSAGLCTSGSASGMMVVFGGRTAD